VSKAQTLGSAALPLECGLLIYAFVQRRSLPIETTVSHPWLALAVRSRHEKSVQTILIAKGYRTALPLLLHGHKRRSGGDWESQKPLIPGYVFAVDDPGNPFRIATTSGVVEIVSFGGQPVTIPEAELEALERIAASGLPVTHCACTRPDETVELIAGPLKGMQGILVRKGKVTCLAVGAGIRQPIRRAPAR